MPWKGYNFEDGIVITESAAKKFTSLNMYKKSIRTSRDGILDKERFKSLFPDKLSLENYNKLDKNGIIKVGETINPTELLVAYAEQREMTPTEQLLRNMNKTRYQPFANKSLEWDKAHSGVVKYIRTNGRNITIHELVENPMDIGDKLSASYGNKGIVTKIIPDHEAPHNEKGERYDVILSPSGVPGRINPSQILETAAGKVAKKTGKVYKVENFTDKTAFNTANEERLEGLDLFDENNYFAAIPFFLKANEFNPNNADLNLKIGISYLHTNKKQKAGDYWLSRRLIVYGIFSGYFTSTPASLNI
jgi:DNA-directed RNA polymerase beta subunit